MNKFNWSNPPYKIKKDGTQSKLHDRSVFRTPGNEVELAYGTFTVLKAEKVNKIWYVTLKDVNKTFKIKQQQMGNKKLPKTRVIINDMQPVIAGLLPAPKELIDQLVEQVERLIKQYNEQLINDPANYTTRGKLKKVAQESILETYEQFIQDPQYNTVFKNKIDFISNGLDSWGDKNLTKHIYKQLKRTYHPDNVNINSDDYFTFITKKFKNI